MSKNDVDELWNELNSLKADVEALKVRREELSRHADELRALHESLLVEADKAEKLARQVDEMLAK